MFKYKKGIKWWIAILYKYILVGILHVQVRTLRRLDLYVASRDVDVANTNTDINQPSLHIR